MTFKNVNHVTFNFVDDSSSIIGFYDFDIMKHYLESYYTLLQAFYDMNKLKINADKTNLTINAKPCHKNQVKRSSRNSS